MYLISYRYYLNLNISETTMNIEENKYVFRHLTQSCFQERPYENDSESIYLDNSISFIY